MHSAPVDITNSNAAATAAGVGEACALTGMWIGLATRFTTDPKPSLAVRRRR
jgi:hypothetical protein